MKMNIYRTWPYISTPIGVLILLYVFYLIIHNSQLPNYNEYLGKILGWILISTYMIHQFEEHGIDIKGEKYSFQKSFCKFFGYNNVNKCPGDEKFIFSVNVPGLYIAGIIAGLFNNTRPIAAGGFAAVLLINAFAHSFGSIRIKEYNPGLMTSLLLFIPISIYYFYKMYQIKKLSKTDIGLCILIGILYHIVIILSFQLIKHNKISHTTLNLINILNGFLPLISSEIIRLTTISSIVG